MKKKKFVRKYTAFNVFANIFLILFLILNVANVLLDKFGSKLESVRKFIPNVRTWASDYIVSGWGEASGIIPKLILIAIGVGALLVFILSMCFAKHGKGWNFFSWALILGDIGWFVYSVINSEVFAGYSFFDFSNFAERSILKSPDDINLFVHVIVFLFLSFALAKGTKRVAVVENADGELVEEKKEELSYRTVTLTRKVSPFCRAQQFECWFNGEKLSTIGDGQEKNFLVDRYGAELVVVSPDGAESNIVYVPEGDSDERYVISTSRNATGILSITVA